MERTAGTGRGESWLASAEPLSLRCCSLHRQPLRFEEDGGERVCRCP
jgi:hypothetical protein